MTPRIFDAGGVSAQPLALDGPFLWLLLAFALFALGSLAWLLLGSYRQRLTKETVLCPIQGKSADLRVHRAEGGKPVDVKTCSLMSPPGYVTCHRACLSQVRA